MSENKVTFSKDNGKTFADLPNVYAEAVLSTLKAIKNAQPAEKVEGNESVIIAANWSHGEKEYCFQATIEQINKAVNEINKLADVYNAYTTARKAYQDDVNLLCSKVYLLLNPVEEKEPGKRGRKAKEQPANPMIG